MQNFMLKINIASIIRNKNEVVKDSRSDKEKVVFTTKAVSRTKETSA